MAGRSAEVIEVNDAETGLTGWIAVNTSVDGLSFGGCRIAMSVTREMVTELAECMTYKLALHGLPMGGAKGGIKFDPTAPDAAMALRRFGQKAADALKSRVVLGKDLGANDQLIAAIYEGVGAKQLLPVAGLAGSGAPVPERLSQLQGYISHMTGQGVAWATEAALGDRLKGKRIIIQGFGAVGAGTVVRLAPYGVRVVGVSDKGRCIYNAKGLPTETMVSLNENKEIPIESLDSRQFEVLPTEQLFQLDADILVCAASSHCVNEQHIRSLKAKWIAEGANFALTPAARQEAQARGITVVPDVIANSSSAAMVTMQMAAGNRLNADQMWETIRKNIFNATQASAETAARKNWTMRDAYLRDLVPSLLEKAMAGKSTKKAS